MFGKPHGIQWRNNEGNPSFSAPHTWWLIPLSKWVITPVISGLTLLIPFITGVITHLLSGMSHQVGVPCQSSLPLLQNAGPIGTKANRDARRPLGPLGPLGTCWTSACTRPLCFFKGPWINWVWLIRYTHVYTRKRMEPFLRAYEGLTYCIEGI